MFVQISTDNQIKSDAESNARLEEQVRTAKGLHLYYRYTGARAMRNTVKVKFHGEPLAIDVRAEGGYVVGPGSVHPTGFVYTREGNGWR